MILRAQLPNFSLPNDEWLGFINNTVACISDNTCNRRTNTRGGRAAGATSAVGLAGEMGPATAKASLRAFLGRLQPPSARPTIATATKALSWLVRNRRHSRRFNQSRGATEKF